MMKPTPDSSRVTAYGQHYSPTWVDNFGTWLSWRKIGHFLPLNKGSRPRLGDFGAGYNAVFTRRAMPQIISAVVIDLQLCADLKNIPCIRAIEGSLPAVLEALDAATLDIIICNSVLEHLSEPNEMLRHLFRLLAPGGVCLVNVPSWRGKWFLEFSAFQLGLSPVEEMDDHKNYYDPRDLWPLLVRAGFRPSHIQCARHKFGLNTFAACRKSGTA